VPRIVHPDRLGEASAMARTSSRSELTLKSYSQNTAKKRGRVKRSFSYDLRFARPPVRSDRGAKPHAWAKTSSKSELRNKSSDRPSAEPAYPRTPLRCGSFWKLPGICLGFDYLTWLPQFDIPSAPFYPYIKGGGGSHFKGPESKSRLKFRKSPDPKQDRDHDPGGRE
jgi:hypothetical protein